MHDLLPAHRDKPLHGHRHCGVDGASQGYLGEGQNIGHQVGEHLGQEKNIVTKDVSVSKVKNWSN